MLRADLMHVVHAAASISEEREIVVIGSQAILGVASSPPSSMLVSMEADVFPLLSPEKAELIDGAIGDGSPFQEAFGYYAHGVGPETAVPPTGWRDRLVAVEVPRRPTSDLDAIALCLEPHDLVLSKLVAGRQRDIDYARDAIAADLVDPDVLLARVETLPIEAVHLADVRRMLSALVGR